VFGRGFGCPRGAAGGSRLISEFKTFTNPIILASRAMLLEEIIYCFTALIPVDIEGTLGHIGATDSEMNY
jgi:hypothetical protein